MAKTLLTYAALFFGMAFFGTGTPTTKVVTSGFPVFLAPFLRLLIAAILTTPILFIYRRQLNNIDKSGWRYIIGIGAVGLVAFSIFLITGMKMVNGVAGAMVMSLSPAAMAVGASLFLKDSLGWRKTAAVLLSVIGVLIINTSGKTIQAQGAFELFTGSLLVFGAVCSATLYSLFAKKVTANINPALLIPIAAWTAVLLFAIPGLYQAASFEFSKPDTEQWIALIWWGIGPFGIGTLLWFVGLKAVKASTASGFMGAMPASGLMVSYFWLGDQFYYIHILGFVLILGGIGMVSWAHWVSERKAKQKGEEYSPPHVCPC